MGVMEEILAELRKLNATMSHIGVAASAPADVPPAPADKPKPEKAKPKAEAPKVEAPKVEAPKADVAPAFDYPAVSAATKVKVTGGKRAEVVALLASYGVKHGQELKPEQYPEYMAKLAAL